MNRILFFLSITAICVNLFSPTAAAQCTSPTSNTVNNTSCTTATGSITFIGPLPSANYQYSIDGGVTFGTAGQTVFNGLFGGSYSTVSKEIATGCVSSVTVKSITNPPSPANPSSTVAANTDCSVPNGTVTFSGPTPLVNYQFSINGGVTYGAAGITTFTGLNGGSYATVSKSVTSSCISGMTTKIINNPTIAAPVSTTAAVTNCLSPNGSITFTAQAGFVFSIDGGATFGAVGQTVFSNLNPGTYVTQSKQTATNCLSSTSNKTVGGPAVTAPTSSVTNISNCAAPNGAINFSAPTPLVNYAFSIDGGTTFGAAGQTSFPNLGAAAYPTAVKLISSGCVSPIVNKTINIQAVASPTGSVTNVTNCNTPNGKITITGPTPLANYQYSIDGGTTFGTTGQIAFNNLAAGTYPTVAKLVSSGCISQTPNAKVISNPAVAAPTSTVTASSCSSSTGSITFTGPTPTANFSYSVDNGVTFGTQGQTSFTGLAAGSYTTKTRSTVGCISSGSTIKTISNTVTTAPTTAAGSNPTTCSPPNGVITFNGPTPLANYQFSVDGGATFGAAGVTTFSNLSGGSYVTKSRAVATGCNSTAVNKVLSNPTVTAPTATKTNVSDCVNQDGSISITAPTPLSNYQFSIDGGTTFGTVGQGSFTNLVEGVYSPVSKLISTGCVSVPATNLTITKPAEAGTIKNICQYQQVTMDATALASGSWTQLPGNPAVAVFANPASPTSLVSGFTTIGTYIYVWGSVSCSDTVTITVNDCVSPIINSSNAFLYQSNGSTGTDVLTVDLATGVQSTLFTAINGNSGNINAIGYNVTDGEIWGSVVNGSGTALTGDSIARIGNDGIPHYYFVQGLYSGGYTSGTIDNNGILYLYQNNQTQIFKVDVNPTSPTFLTLLAPVLTTTAVNISDWAYNPIDGLLYSVGLPTPHKLYRTNPVTGVTTAVGNVTGNATFTAGAFGAAYMDASGNLYVGDNTAGGIYKINTVQNVSGNTTAALRSQGQPSSGNDGALNHNGCIKPDAGRDTLVCISATATMSATQVSGLQWIASPGNPGTANITYPDSANTTINGFSSAGTYSFLWLNGTDCSDTAIIRVFNCQTDTVIVYSCDTCSQTICSTPNPDIPVTDTTAYNTCGLSVAASALGTLTLDVNGCAQWTPIGTQVITDSIKTCVTSCNGPVCDTTYIIILPQSIPLPIDFTDINGSSANCQVYINWSVANGANRNFNVERTQSGGGTWSNLAKVPAGSSQNLYHYSFVDMDAPNGRLLYRIKMTDLDGQHYKYSPTVLVNNNCTGNSINIYPNPSTVGMGINIRANVAEEVSYQVYDMTGKCIRKGSFTGKTSIQTLQQGTYIVRAQASSLNVVEKIIIY